jgi:hypothetical protein
MSDVTLVTAIVATNEDFSVCRRTVEYLARQTIVDSTALIVVCPSREALAPDEDLLSAFASYRIVEVAAASSTGAMLAAGIQSTETTWFMYFEEHHFPPPELLERAIEEMQGTDNVALGFALTSANPGTVADAHLYLQFGDVVAPLRTGPAERLGGHHAFYRTDALRPYGDALADLMANEAVLHEDFGRRGVEMRVLGDVPIPHVQLSDIRSLMRQEYIVQRIYGEARAQHLGWSPLRRATYILGAPLIPFVRMVRIFGNVRRTRRGVGFFLKIVPPAFAAACAGALGEAQGYAFGSSQRDKTERLGMELDRYAFTNEADRAGPRAPRN